MLRPMRLLSITLTVALVAAAFVAPAVTATDAAGPGRLHLTGAAAANFVVPRDAIEVASWTDSAHDLTYTRYQQYARPFGTHVAGAQLTVVERGRRQVLVIGSYFAGLTVAALPAISAFVAKTVAARSLGGFTLPPGMGARLKQQGELRYDPVARRLFYRVSSTAPGVRLVHEIDAATGDVIDSWDALAETDALGTGVKGDTKNLTVGPAPGFGNLTSNLGSGQYPFKMLSQDGRFATYDAANTNDYGAASPLVADDNDQWTAGSQSAGVDAQFYAALTAAFYEERFDFDLFDAVCVDPVFDDGIRSVVRYDDQFYPPGYGNAFWDGEYMVYGVGDGETRAMSSAQDVVTHELSHGVTQCRGDLDYHNEPGALNEAFSDIMAAATEWDYEEDVDTAHCRLAPGQTRCADWLLGEDTYIDPDAGAFRDFADPASEGQPSHWDGRVYLGKAYDNGGVHFNSGIINHAFYLMVNGGQNARCAGPTDPQADCDINVPAMGLADAEQIFFAGFGLLTFQASFCEARAATLAAAKLLHPEFAADYVAVDLGWAAVGRSGAACGESNADFNVSVVNPVAAAQPGGEATLAVTVTRGTESDPIDLDVDLAGPVGSPSFNPNPSVTPNNTSQLTIPVNGNASDGVYPVLVSATSGSATHYVSAALVVDSTDPVATISKVVFVAGATVGTDGKITQRVTWSLVDDVSGAATATLERSPNGSSAWSTVFGPGAPLGQTDYSAAAGAHFYRLTGTDAAGNSAVSSTLGSSLSAFQEGQATYTKKASWRTFASGTAYGTTRFTKRRGASATFTFIGKSVAWIAQKGPKRGNAYVYVDGVRSSVSLYATTLKERQVVFVKMNLGPGSHTIKIVCRGTSNRPRIDVDGIFVLNQ